MFGWFKKKAVKEDVEKIENAVQTGFNNVKQDISNITEWIKHLDSKDSEQEDEISEIKEEISTIKYELGEIKNMLEILGNDGLFKQRQTVFNKQTAVQGVQTAVQTPVQTVELSNFLNNLSVTERALIWVLLNSDMKLSYDDLSAMLGKDKATIRGQINSIKQKSESLIQEQIGKNNKKRYYISEKIKQTLLKSRKVRVKNKKKSKKRANAEEK
jgi:predicted transcriptional regulator